ncbi:ugt-25 [Pristionchus pacificus]|nr:ugt-25 [Pristionchus pacificus]
MKILLLFFLLGSVNALKFLAYSPQFAKSHVNFMGKISDILIDGGHEVVLLSPILDSSLGFAGTKKARIIEVPQCDHAVVYEDFMQNSNAANAWTSDSFAAFFEWDAVFSSWISQCNATVLHPGLIQSLRDEKFDVAFAEAIDFCAPGLFHLIGIDKWAVTDSLAINDAHFFYTHTPSNPSYVPTMMGGNMGEEMSFSERFSNLFTFCFSKWFNERWFPVYDEMFRTHDKDIQPVEELFASNSIVFTNSEPLVDFPRPSSARIIDIGGIVVSSGHKELNQTWSSILDLRPQTVFISFGTVAKAYLMPEEYKKSVLEVIKSFPNVTFIWKYEQPSDQISEGIDNLIESTWVPQSDLLHDRRVSAFITHCGQGSTTEAISAGVPLVVIPVAYDQLRNAQQVKRNGHGIMMEKTELSTPQTLKNAVKEILENKRYRENALKIKLMLEERPFNMKEIFIRNMEFLGKHGPLRQLDHYGRHLSFIQYYLIDVILALSSAIAFAVILIVFILKFVVGKVIRMIRISKMKSE